jgi:hypothetical protein
MTAMSPPQSHRPKLTTRLSAVVLTGLLILTNGPFAAFAAAQTRDAAPRPAPAPGAAVVAIAPLGLNAAPLTPAAMAPALAPLPALTAALSLPPSEAAPAAPNALADGAALKASTPALGSSPNSGEQEPAPEKDEELAQLFDGSGFTADDFSISLNRPDGSPVTTTLSRLKGTLRGDATLAGAVNGGGDIRAALHNRMGRATVARAVETRLRGYLQAQGLKAPFRLDRSQESAWSRLSHSVHFDWQLLRDAPKILKECWTVPNKQDYFFLGTKTFGLNLAVRLYFAHAAVAAGSLPLLRAVLSTGWYQAQDSMFTVFGQTYMKFIGRMTGLLRIGPGYFGDFLFTYVQLTTFEFLNRLVLGPIGENPLVYTWHGMALIFSNIFMGMISGGPLIPAINKMYQAGVINHSTRMVLYQLASLTMQFGLFATFGFQHIYSVLTWGTLILSWGAYAFFTVFFKPKPGVKRPTGL